ARHVEPTQRDREPGLGAGRGSFRRAPELAKSRFNPRAAAASWSLFALIFARGLAHAPVISLAIRGPSHGTPWARAVEHFSTRRDRRRRPLRRHDPHRGRTVWRSRRPG